MRYVTRCAWLDRFKLTKIWINFDFIFIHFFCTIILIISYTFSSFFFTHLMVGENLFFMLLFFHSYFLDAFANIWFIFLGASCSLWKVWGGSWTMWKILENFYLQILMEYLESLKKTPKYFYENSEKFRKVSNKIQNIFERNSEKFWRKF